jgi:hypothetical protein
MVEVRRGPGGPGSPRVDPGGPAGGTASEAGIRRPRIVRQRGVAGLIEAAYSQLYRFLLLVIPLR